MVSEYILIKHTPLVTQKRYSELYAAHNKIPFLARARICKQARQGFPLIIKGTKG